MPMEQDTQIVLAALKESQSTILEANREMARQIVGALDRGFEGMKEQAAIERALSTGKKPNGNGNAVSEDRSQTVGMFVGIAGLIFGLCGVFLMFYGMPSTEQQTIKEQHDRAESVSRERIEEVDQKYDQRTAESDRDRGAIRANMKAFEQQLVEVETQFRAADTVHNVERMWTDRLVMMLWTKANPDMPLPPRDYWPSIARTQVQQGEQ